MFMATTAMDVFRDIDVTDTDIYGDPIETGSRPWKENVPASVALTGMARSQLTDLQQHQINSYSIRVPGSAGIREGDRLRDRRTGSKYLVLKISTPQVGMGMTSVRMVCTRVGTSA